MKKSVLLPVFAVFLAAILFTSCHPSRVYAYKDHSDQKREKMEKKERKYARGRDYDDRYAPRPSYSDAPYVSLVLRPTPGFVMNRYSDGRFYHRSATGFMYWKGYDNRFYLDRGSISRVRYNNQEYDEWRYGISHLDRGGNP